MPRVVEPMRRALPLAEWPAVDQACWAAAITPADFLGDGGLAAHWAARTKQTNVQHYGRFLGYLRWLDVLDEKVSPPDRVTRERIREYDRHLANFVAPRTRLAMLVGLKVVMQAFAPGHDWDWLRRFCNRVQTTAKPQRDKRAKMLPTSVIFRGALAELERVPSHKLSIPQAIRYRDALMLALLAARPLRVKNFTSLEVGRHVSKNAAGWLIDVPAEETKTNQAIAFSLPEPLTTWFEFYLNNVRPLFSGAAQSRSLWLGQQGPPSARFVWSRITKTTQRLFGKTINPHLLRDCAASSLASESSQSALFAAALLGHRHWSTTEKWYIQADNLAASRRVNAILRQLRRASADCILLV